MSAWSVSVRGQISFRCYRRTPLSTWERNSCSTSRGRFLSENVGHLALDCRPVEKARVGTGVQAGGVGEGELTEVLLGHETVLEYLERVRHHLGEIRDVEMREVRAEDRPQPRTE